MPGARSEAQVLYARGSDALAAGDLSLAGELLERCCTVDPSHAAAHHLLGKVRAGLGDPAGAEQLQRRSCQLDPQLGWNWFCLGELLFQQASYEQAAEAFQRAQDQLPTQPWIGDLLAEASALAYFRGERLADGLGVQGYQRWIEHLEERLPLPCLPLQQRWWLKPPPDGSSEGWLVLLADDALLRPGALQALEHWLGAWSTDLPDLLYCDEDRITPQGRRFDPWFKPDWVPESFWSTPWFGSCSIWRLSWVRHQQLPLPPACGVERSAWLFRALNSKPRIGHIPQVLVHRSGVPEAATAAVAEQLARHLAVQQEEDVVVQPRLDPPGSYQLSWPVPAGVRCRVVIPSRDRADLLGQCLATVLATAGSMELELVVVDNGSVEASFQQLCNHWQQQLGARFRCIRDEGEFNWSRLNNQGAREAATELLLFLNNDIEADQPGWLEAMAAQALRPAIGCVGAVLRYPDGLLQHAGVVVGMHGGADHAYRSLPLDHGVHRGRSRCLTGWGAVTGACLMVRRDLFERVGGFDPALPVEFNDIEFCLRLGQLGYRHVIPPEASLIHHESQSRDALSSPTAAAALRRMQALWNPRLMTTAPWWPAACEPHCPDGRPKGLHRIR